MLCVVCEKLSPDKYIQTDNGRVEFHSACAVCYICGKSNSDSVAPHPASGGWLFIHETCAFTPDQMSKLLELQHGYRPE